jgi:hypothetical protein
MLLGMAWPASSKVREIPNTGELNSYGRINGFYVVPLDGQATLGNSLARLQCGPLGSCGAGGLRLLSAEGGGSFETMISICRRSCIKGLYANSMCSIFCNSEGTRASA